ncbi:sialic acid-binding Ig-like lectin 14 isoform X1 [Mustela putorius furo]|uniref:Sialic acid-binding Ig-like lectin 14 isoform X1 n=1 Tax=Mustela putorius furo TaxID=9669 RepID=A0A8U0UZN0_MUSPF|nr:sialic acid-binding Ig-like lectin 14 isoform X1 [Mustela putorius furo]
MPADADMVSLLLLPLLWGGSLQEDWGYQLRVQDTVTVQEGLCVHVPCSFSYPWSSWPTGERPYMYWFQSGDSSHNSQLVATNDPTKTVKTEFRDRFNLVRKPQENDCSLRIREARRSDQGLYKFQIGKDYVRYTYRDKQLNLQVAALTQEPDIHFLEPLKSGYPTNLTCSLRGSCEEGRPLSFFWMGGALDSLDPQTLHSSVLTLTPRVQDHGSNLTCQVHLPGVQGTVERTIRLNVSYAPQLMTTRVLQGNYTVPKMLSNGMSLPVLEGQFLSLVCIADSNPPAMLSWSREGKALSPSQPSAPGVLELLHVGVEDEGEFTCQAQNPLGSQCISISLSVRRSPSSCNCVSEKQEGSWPLVLTLIRGFLMGAGFLLAYGLTWIYYTSHSSLHCLEILPAPEKSLRRHLSEVPSSVIHLFPWQADCWNIATVADFPLVAPVSPTYFLVGSSDSFFFF